MKIATLISTLMFWPVCTFAQIGNDTHVDAMRHYDCVYKSFFKQVPQAKSIEDAQDLTKDGIEKIALLIDEPVRLAMKLAANRTYQSIKIKRADGIINPDIYFETYIGELSNELPKHMDFSQCVNMDDLTGDVYDVVVNRYISNVIGNGKLHQWFENNGGSYTQSAFIATLVGIEISDQEVNLDEWKQFYKSYVKRKFESPK
jgi:hypothetical protein